MSPVPSPRPRSDVQTADARCQRLSPIEMFGIQFSAVVFMLSMLVFTYILDGWLPGSDTQDFTGMFIMLSAAPVICVLSDAAQKKSLTPHNVLSVLKVFLPVCLLSRWILASDIMLSAFSPAARLLGFAVTMGLLSAWMAFWIWAAVRDMTPSTGLFREPLLLSSSLALACLGGAFSMGLLSGYFLLFDQASGYANIFLYIGVLGSAWLMFVQSIVLALPVLSEESSFSHNRKSKKLSKHAEEQLLAYGMALSEEEDTLQADGMVGGVSVLLKTIKHHIPYRLRLTLEMPNLPEGFSMMLRRKQRDGKINDVVLDGMFAIEGLSPEAARMLLAGLHTPLMAMASPSMSFSIRDQRLVVEHRALQVFKDLRRDQRILLLDDAITVATRINQRAAAAKTRSTARHRSAACMAIGSG